MPNLTDLAEKVDGSLIGDGSLSITHITHDSRSVVPGALYVAIRGMQTDGHRFVPSAVASGASAVCVEEPSDTSVPQLLVPDTRRVLGELSSAVFGNPTRRFALIGVTGTNGKTTVTHMIEAITTAAGMRTGLIGTVGARVSGGSRADSFRVPLDRTTPEATDLQALFADMADAGADVVVMEVSSHALALGRVSGSEFDIGAFTNLSQDHLDFHESMEEYFLAKARLFAMAQHSIVNIADVWGQRLAADSQAVTVGDSGTISASDVVLSVDHSTFVLSDGDESIPIHLPMAGSFNIDNALVAAACARGLDVDLSSIARGLSALVAVPGRFEYVSDDSDLDVVVDYAHTPDGVEHVVRSAQEITAGRVIAVVGAGGDRDPGKRPLMGAAGSLADRLFVTSDNPRSEDPDVIIEQVVAGVADGIPVDVIENRRDAIFAAIRVAEVGDLVLILGKGHEQGQDVGGTVVPFDDRTVAREAMGVSQ